MTDHSTWDQLVDFAEERLPEWEAHALAEHLEQCEVCAADVKWLQSVLARLDDHPSAQGRSQNYWRREHVKWGALSPATFYRSSRVRWTFLLAGVLLVTSLFLLRSPAEFVASVQTLRGTAHIAEPAGTAQPLQVNHTVIAGDTLSTGMDGEVTLNFGDERVALTLYPDSEVQITQIRLREGTLERVAVKQMTGVTQASVRNGQLALYSTDAVLSSKDALFKVRQFPSGTVVLTVRSGAVQVTKPDGSRLVGQGDTLIIPSVRSRSEPGSEPTAWPTSLPPPLK